MNRKCLGLSQRMLGCPHIAGPRAPPAGHTHVGRVTGPQLCPDVCAAEGTQGQQTGLLGEPPGRMDVWLMRPLSLPSSTLKLWDYSKGKVSRGGRPRWRQPSQELGQGHSGGVPTSCPGAGGVCVSVAPWLGVEPRPWR